MGPGLFTDEAFGGNLPPLTDTSSSGFLGGFQAGANWQTGSWVGGVEIDLSATRIQGASTVALTSLPFMFSESASQTDKFDWLGSGRARLGYLVWPNVLFYGTGRPGPGSSRPRTSPPRVGRRRRRRIDR